MSNKYRLYEVCLRVIVEPSQSAPRHWQWDELVDAPVSILTSKLMGTADEDDDDAWNKLFDRLSTKEDD